MRLFSIGVAGALVALSFSCTPASAQSRPINAKSINASIVITAGNTFQSLLAAGTRQSLTIQNNNTTTDNCWVFLGATGSATKGTSILLQPGQSYTRYFPFIPSDAIAATCATTNNTIYVDTQ